MDKICKIMDAQVRKSIGKRATKRMRKDTMRDLNGYIRIILESPKDKYSEDNLQEMYRFKKILQDEIDPEY